MKEGSVAVYFVGCRSINRDRASSPSPLPTRLTPPCHHPLPRPSTSRPPFHQEDHDMYSPALRSYTSFYNNGDGGAGLTLNGVAEDDSDDDDSMLVVHQPQDVGTPLLKHNVRKLRHVVGITLRNLTLKSPEHAKRRASLAKWRRRSSNEFLDDTDNVNTREHQKRRRSTLAAPSTHQVGVEIEQTLQGLNLDQLLDSAFAIYVPSQSTPVYISEMAHGSMNPEFREMDFSRVYCRNENFIKLVVWAKMTSEGSWKQLLDKAFDLRSLQFICRSIDMVRSAFPPNSFIVQLEDGCYVLPRRGLSLEELPARHRAMSNSPSSVPTCSFDTVMKLNNLLECIKDSQNTIESVRGHIDQKLGTKSGPSYFIQQKERDQLAHQLKHTKRHIESERSRTKQIHKQMLDLKAQLKQREKAMAKQDEHRKEALQQLSAATTQVSSKQEAILVQGRCISAEVARLATQLQEIFPIDPVPNKFMQFSICGLPLPSVKHGKFDEDEVAAAFGFASQLVYSLSQYLDVPLRYPIQPYGSNSFIVDPISTIQGSRTFPLWIKGSLYYRFEYAVYLFHKDMEQLINSQDLPVADLTQTLPNLKNLLLVLSSYSA